MDANRPYQVCLYVGQTPPALDGVKTVDLTPSEPTAEAVLTALRDSGLAPGDLRSRVLFCSEADAQTTVLAYAALMGFAGRRLDVSIGNEAHLISEFDESLRRLPDAGRPAATLEQIQVGSVAHPELPTVTLSAALSPEQVSLVRYARRVRFVPAAPALAALTELVMVAAIRVRQGKGDRLPFLVQGDEPGYTDETVNDVVGICLDMLRRDAEELRRSLRSDNRDSLAEQVELTARQKTLLAAAAQPIEDVLVKLGTRLGENGEEWHCPRPDRHSNGDANASMKITRGKARCFRCDPERMDALRLTMDVRRCSADEAAAWLLA